MQIRLLVVSGDMKSLWLREANPINHGNSDLLRLSAKGYIWP
jgi:hypothetical protein